MSRLTTKTSIMERKHDLRYGCAKNWKKVERYYLIENAVDKLGTLENIEEELNIDLITLFNALKDGIYYNSSNEFFKKPTLYYSNYNNCWCFDLALGTYIVRLKDYKKTWWLKEDLEND